MAENEIKKTKKKIVTKDEAVNYLESRKSAAMKNAVGAFLCIISPSVLILLSAFTNYGLDKKLSVSIGGAVLVIVLAFAISMLASATVKNSRYDFLGKENFITDEETDLFVKDLQEKYRDKYEKANIAGTFLCVVSPLMIMAVSSYNNDFLTKLSVVVCLLLVSLGTLFYTWVGVKWAGFERLLQHGEFTARRKKGAKVKRNFTAYYWIISIILFFVICTLSYVCPESDLVLALHLHAFSKPVLYFAFSALFYFVSTTLLVSYFKSRDE